MDNSSQALPEDSSTHDAPDLEAALAATAAPGHYDELHGVVPAESGEASRVSFAPTPEWRRFFDLVGADGDARLNASLDTLERQIHDNGVTYNVYADADGPQRPWSLDLFPLIVSPRSWRQIEAGVLQRVRLLDRVMADVYGEQSLLEAGLLPPALVHGHPGYLRAMHGVVPVAQTHLHIVAFDLARGPDGLWWLVSQRTQAPSGLGYLLENRISIGRLFPEAFEALHVERLAATYRAFVEGLKQMSTAGVAAHIALLTPGPYNETYFEHAYLARYLGITLVQSNDLTVRGGELFLKTLQGLEPVHVLIKRVDDAWIDPLELRPDSKLGVPGLLQAVRAGNLLVANAPGSAFLESSALLGFLPAIAEQLLGETLELPSLPTWWCGEWAVMEEILPRLADCVIKPTYSGSQRDASFDAVLGNALSRRKLDEWTGRIMRQGDEYTVQASLPLSQMPTWDGDPQQPRIVPRSAILRVFAVSDGPQSWRVLPGGLARLVGPEAGIASMQRGGSSADVWMMAEGQVDRTTLLQPRVSPASIAQRKRLVTSRAAENLFWLGRYTERAENCLRLARLILECPYGDDAPSPSVLDWLSALAERNGLLVPGVPSLLQARRVFERSVMAALFDTSTAASVGYNLRAARTAASAIRERLSHEHWNLVVQAERDFFAHRDQFSGSGEYPSHDAVRLLEATNAHLAGMTGAQTDRMTRDDGWRLLSIGRQLERLGFLATTLKEAFETDSVGDPGGFEAILALFDNTITFHARYQQSRDVAALIELLVVNRDNPRSLAWVVLTLRGRLAKVSGNTRGEADPAAWHLSDSEAWSLDDLCDAEHALPALSELLDQCITGAWRIASDISVRYFTHTQSGQTVGA